MGSGTRARAKRHRPVAVCIALCALLMAALGGAARAQKNPGFADIVIMPMPVAGSGFAGVGGGFAGAGGGIAPGPLPFVLNAAAPIPGDGGILIGGAQPSVTVVPASATASTAIVGTLIPLGSFWVWIPMTPLGPGTYTVTTMANGSTVVTNIEVIEPATYDSPAIELAASLSRSQINTNSDCCRSWLNGSQFSTSCFEVSAHADAVLSIVLSSEALPEQLGQFVFQAHPDYLEPSEALFPNGPLSAPMSVRYAEQAEQYCFEIEAIDIVTGAKTVYEGLEPGCLPHGELGSVGSVTHDLVGLGLLDAARCELPPFGFESVWCEHNDEVCAIDDAPQGCRSYEYICEGGAPPEEMGPIGSFSGIGGTGGLVPPPVGARGGAGGAGGAGTADDDAAGDSGEQGQAGMPGGGSSDGCSVSARPASRRGLGAVLSWPVQALVLALVLLARRRTRGR